MKGPAALQLDVYTTPARSFTSAAPPEGPGDDPTWSPSSSTLIFGEHEAVLVDLPPTDRQVDELADWIEKHGRELTRVYITHGHGDHWLGLARLAQRFPGIHGLATPEVRARAEFETSDAGISGYWAAVFPGETPVGEAKVLPELLDGRTLDLEGNTLEVISIGRADTAESTALYVPSLSAFMPGDLVYNRVHMMTAEAGPAELAEWIANLGKVQALKPAIVVSGDKQVALDNDPATIAESRQYLEDFSRISAASDTAADIVAQMVERYPSWENRRTLWHSSRAAIARRGSRTDQGTGR